MARVTVLHNDYLNLKNNSSHDYPLLINTAGYYDASTPFKTFNSIGRDDYYLLYLVDGQLSVIVDNKEYTIKKGSAVIFPPKYKYKYFGNPPVHYLYAHFTGSYAKRFLEECGFNTLPCIIETDFKMELQNKFNLMINTYLYNEPLSIQKCAYLLQEILIDIYEYERDKKEDSPLKISLNYIHTFFTSKIDIPHLANLENLSNSRYITVFKNQIGKSPNEYIIDLRLQLAKSLLDNTNMSIRQISENVGYTDQYFFSRLFKRHIGVSPQGYRKNKNTN